MNHVNEGGSGDRMGKWGGIPCMSLSFSRLRSSQCFSLAGIWGLCENVDKAT